MKILYTTLLFYLLGNGEYIFDINGGSLVEPLYDHWTFVYTVLDANATIEFKTIPTTSQRFASLFYGETDAVSVSGLVNDTLLQPGGDRLVNFSVVATSIVPAYNIPDLAYKDGRTDTPILTLSMQTLANIFSRNITTWNDSQISNDNPDVLLPAQNITVVVRSDAAGVTTVFMDALNKSATNWPFGSANWPNSVLASSDYFSVQGDNGMTSVVQNIPYTIGYVSLGILLDQNNFVTTYANLINARGMIVNASAANVTADITEPGSGWPILTSNSLYFRNDTECHRLRSLLKFFYWTQTSPLAISEVTALGYAPLSDARRKQAIDTLLHVTCENRFVLAVQEQPMHTSKAFPAFLGFSMVLLGISIVLLVFWFMFHPTIRKTVPIIFYQALQFTGITTVYISVIFWYFIPSETWVCTSRLWLTSIGFTLVIVAMFERTWRIQRVHRLVEQGNQLSGKLISMLEIGGGVFAIIIVQIIILTIWTVVDPYTDVQETVAAFEIRWMCESKYGGLWLALEASYFGLLLIWGVYVVYSSWKLKNAITESRWILASMYNNLLLLVLLVAELRTIQRDDERVVYFVAPVIMLANTNVVLAVYLPTVLKQLKIIQTGSGSGKTSEMGTTL